MDSPAHAMPRNLNHLTIGEAKAAGCLPSGALLQFRGAGATARVIQVAGRGGYSHSAMVVNWDGDPYCCESRELKGCRAVTLKSQVDRYSKLIDVYLPRTNGGGYLDLDEAARWMRRLAGADYGYLGVAQAALLHLPVVRLFLKPPSDPKAGVWDERPPFCSEAVSLAYRLAGGADVVPNLPDRLTEPNDLTRSGDFSYACTLLAER